MQGTAATQPEPTKRLKRTGFSPKDGDLVEAFQRGPGRDTGRAAWFGPHRVYGVTTGAVLAVDQQDSKREFMTNIWRLVPAGQKGGQ